MSVCVEDGGGQQAGVAVVDSGQRVGEVHRDPGGDARGEPEHVPFPAAAWQQAAVEGGDRASPSMLAMRMVPSLMLVPVVMKLLVKSSRCRPEVGAKVGANVHSHQATQADIQRASSQVMALSADLGLRPATR